MKMGVEKLDGKKIISRKEIKECPFTKLTVFLKILSMMC